ncbi:hypothetical protein A2U01_0032152, partial [Trifolium medium]|nr:hypothetical protein [Trifolium medium]
SLIGSGQPSRYYLLDPSSTLATTKGDQVVVDYLNDGSEGDTPLDDIVMVEVNVSAFADQTMTENQTLGVEVLGCAEIIKDTEGNDDISSVFTSILEPLDASPTTVCGGSSS